MRDQIRKYCRRTGKRMKNHEKKIAAYGIRKMEETEYPQLEDFLYEAIYIPKGAEPPSRSVINNPELQIYISGFGSQRHDNAMVAVTGNRIVGAVWARIMNDYGHIDNNTPSLAISLYEEYRGLGIGTDLMRKMLAGLKDSGYSKTSLSVQKTNFAVKMYQKLGFGIVREHKDEYIMLKYLDN